MLLERSHDLARMTTSLHLAAAGSGCSALVAGEPGAGLTRFLDEVERVATARASPEGVPWLVVRGRAVEEERELPTSLVQQLVQPLLQQLDRTPLLDDATPRTALEGALGVRRQLEGGASLAMSLVNVLQAIARRRPVLLLVDDVHWSDASSSAALRFLSRRLAHSSICLVLAEATTAPGTAHAAVWGDCDVVLDLGPLSRAGARAWLQEHAPDLEPVQERRLLDLARGLPGRLADLTRSAPGDLDALLRRPPASASALRLVHQHLARCSPAERRRLVVLGLLDEPAGEAHVDEVLELVAGAPEAAGPPGAGSTGPTGSAHRDDLLLRAVAAASSSEEDRRVGRAAWVRVLDRASRAEPESGERAVRLEAEARRSEALADDGTQPGALLTRAAALQRSARGLRRLDAGRAGTLLELAARGASGVPGSQVLLLAAEQAWICGAQSAARGLADAARDAARDAEGTQVSGDLLLRGLHHRWAALQALGGGDPDLAARHLSAALLDCASAVPRPEGPPASGPAEEAVLCAAALVLVGGRGRAVEATVRRAASSLTGPAADLLGVLAGLAEPWREAVPADQHRAFDALVRVLDASSWPLHRWAADLAWTLDRTDDVRAACEGRLARGEVSGPLAVDLHLALYACSIEASRARAEEHLLEAESAVRRVEGLAPALGLAVQQARARTSIMDGGAGAGAEVPRSTLVTTETAGVVRATAQRHHARGEVGAALAVLEQLWPQPGDTGGGGARPGALMTSVLFFTSMRQVEVPAAETARHLGPVTDWARGSGSLTAAVTDLQCSALAELDEAGALRLSEQAVDVTRTMGTSNSTALAELVLGMRLRRMRRTVSAREPLRRAMGMFEQTGNSYLVHVSRREYDATAPSRPPRTTGSSVLTSQERTVARLAVQGLANAEIGSHLGISAKTVAHHLQSVYAKLRVQGRAQLGDQVALR